ncbi:hypothetical protein [Parasutterella sp.]|uniref:hypothetical protein n=1 Tax=Parasutterella sp. TaxID=2049037 RepID=UPI003994BF55
MRKSGEEGEKIAELRRRNLLYLLELYGSMANLNSALGRRRTDSVLPQIKNRAFNKEKKLYRKMGYSLAREIEDKLNLDRGWMDKDHPEAFALPDPEIVTKEISSEEPKIEVVEKSAARLPLYKLDRGSSGVSSTLTDIGEIEVPESFARLLPNAGNKKGLEAVYIIDLSLQSKIPFGSIVIFDRKVKTYISDGIYLLKIRKSIVVRQITISAKGGYNVFNDIGEPEYLDSLDTVEILGLAVGGWRPLTL